MLLWLSCNRRVGWLGQSRHQRFGKSDMAMFRLMLELLWLRAPAGGGGGGGASGDDFFSSRAAAGDMDAEGPPGAGAAGVKEPSVPLAPEPDNRAATVAAAWVAAFEMMQWHPPSANQPVKEAADWTKACSAFRSAVEACDWCPWLQREGALERLPPPPPPPDEVELQQMLRWVHSSRLHLSKMPRRCSVGREE